VRGLHFIVPDGFDDPARPSGGNAYDRRVCRGLAADGWTVHMHEIPGPWPYPDSQSLEALGGVVAAIPDGALVLVDGLVGSAAPEVLVPEVVRLRLLVLVHMPLSCEREGEVLAAAASVVTTSAWARRTLLDLYSLPGDRVQVAEPGVDRAELAPGTATAGALLSVAAVIPGKGHDVLVDALAPLTSLRWQCLCVGSLQRDPAFVKRVRRRAADGGMERRLRFPGPQAGAELAQSYAKADLLVLPSRAETYGMVIAEALARGLPVVAAEVGGVPEAMGHGADGTRPGLLVPPDDPAALRDALRAWLEDTDLRGRLRRAARERRESLGEWSTTASVVADALERAA
jgi:glycosyltransferase involved in cell wall biosynthesis